MATLVTIALVMILVGIAVGAFLKLSFAIRREDRTRGSLRLDAPSHSARAARALVGFNASRWG